MRVHVIPGTRLSEVPKRLEIRFSPGEVIISTACNSQGSQPSASLNLYADFSVSCHTSAISKVFFRMKIFVHISRYQ